MCMFYNTATQCLEKFGSQVSGLIQLQAAGMDCFSNTFSVEEKEKIMSSLRSIKRVLDESQEHFWKMVVENRTLAANIDYSIHDAQARLSVVRAELDITNEKLQLLANNHNVIENCKDISNSGKNIIIKYFSVILYSTCKIKIELFYLCIHFRTCVVLTKCLNEIIIIILIKFVFFIRRGKGLTQLKNR